MAVKSDDNIGNNVGFSRGLALTVMSFAVISLYNVVELTFITLIMFKRRRGLYFWSFLVATWGIAPHTIGFIMKFFGNVENLRIFYVTLIIVGWVCMVTGQSVVLYSRLHLVLRDSRILNMVLTMIIVDALICHVPIIVMIYGSNSSNPSRWVGSYTVYEKVQVTIFFLQETIISCLYIWSTYKILKPAGNARERQLRSTMTHLIWMNAVMVLLDLTILATEYSGHYEIQVMYKAALYSVKLKVEFRILNQLMDLTKARSPRAWSKDDTFSGADGTSRRDGRQSNAFGLETIDKNRHEAMSRQKSHLTSSNNYAVNIGPGDHGHGNNGFSMGNGIGITTKFEVEHEVREVKFDSDVESRGGASEEADDIAIHKDETDSKLGFSQRGA